MANVGFENKIRRDCEYVLNERLFRAQGHDDGDLKEVAVHGQVHLAALEFHQALGDVQSQAAAFGVAGGVAPDEPLQQFVGVHVQLVPGDVFDAQDGTSLGGHQVHIHPGVGHGVFDGVAQEVAQDTPQEPSVGPDHHGLMGTAEQGMQVSLGQLVGKFAQRLIHGFHGVHGGQIHAHIAGAGLAHVHQVHDELLQLLALAVQDLQILLAVIFAVGLFQQVHVVDDGGQGGLDVVGDVGDQLGLHPLGPQLLLDGQPGGLGHGVHGLSEAPESAEHETGGDLVIQIALAHDGHALDDLAHIPDPPAQQGNVSGGGYEEEKHPEEDPEITPGNLGSEQE